MNTDFDGGQIAAASPVCGAGAGGFNQASGQLGPYNLLCGSGKLGMNLEQLIIAPTFSKKVNKFTSEGRKLIHKRIKSVSDFEFIYLTKNPVINRSIEYNDNRISLFSAQCGTCAVLGIRLEVNDFHCHHIIPTKDNGNDKYQNLVIIYPDIHRLIHATKTETIHQMLAKLELSKKQIAKVNKFRVKVGNIVI